MVTAIKTPSPARQRLAFFERSTHASIPPRHNGERTHPVACSGSSSSSSSSRNALKRTPTTNTATDCTPAAKRRRSSPRLSPASFDHDNKTTPRRGQATTRQQLLVSLLSDDDDDDNVEVEDSKMPATKTPLYPLVASSSSSFHPKHKEDSKHGTTALSQSAKKLFGKTQTPPTTTNQPPQQSVSPSSAETLKDWLQTTPPEEIERLNREFLENASNATEEECNTGRALQSNFRNVVLSNLTDQELAALNDTATRRALGGPEPVEECYTMSEFQKLLAKAGDNFLDLDELETSRAVRKANQTVERRDSTNQTRAQYGRTMLKASEVCMYMLLLLFSNVKGKHGGGGSIWFAVD